MKEATALTIPGTSVSNSVLSIVILLSLKTRICKKKYRHYIVVLGKVLPNALGISTAVAISSYLFLNKTNPLERDETRSCFLSGVLWLQSGVISSLISFRNYMEL